ncbi:acylphosphatase [Candidatus Peregrinibacteria bacterium]|nr:MAG: acylphosphatase [Candidatus Peregrinibacteria bacterium]
MKHMELYISGKVQGVCFRSLTQSLAKELGLTGYVENLEDGRVHIEAEGTDKDLKELLDWTHRGPDLAEVEKVEIKWSDDFVDYTDFTLLEP